MLGPSLSLWGLRCSHADEWVALWPGFWHGDVWVANLDFSSTSQPLIDPRCWALQSPHFSWASSGCFEVKTRSVPAYLKWLLENVGRGLTGSSDLVHFQGSLAWPVSLSWGQVLLFRAWAASSSALLALEFSVSLLAVTLRDPPFSVTHPSLLQLWHSYCSNYDMSWGVSFPVWCSVAPCTCMGISLSRFGKFPSLSHFLKIFSMS